LEVEEKRVKKWLEGGDKWGDGSRAREREETKPERGTEKVRRGRPSKAESLSRGRRESSGSIISLSKRERATLAVVRKKRERGGRERSERKR